MIVLVHVYLLSDSVVSLVLIDELCRCHQTHGEKSASGIVLYVARRGKRRAEINARNRKVEPQKRAEKEEMSNWFRIWLETPDAFFDWLDVRKKSPEFKAKFPHAEDEE